MTTQLHLLPASGEQKVEFLGHPVRVVTTPEGTFLVGKDVEIALGLEPSNAGRYCPEDQRVNIPVWTPGGTQMMVGVTYPGAMVMAAHRRGDSRGSAREKVDAMFVAAFTHVTTNPAAALESKLDDALAQIATLAALVRAIPAPNVEDVARAVAVALETWEAGKYKRRSDAIKAGHARVGWVPKTGKPATPKRPALTESDVLAALRAELGPVGADNLARRHGWGRQAVREMLLAMEKAGRVEYVSRGPKAQGWRVPPEVV